MLEKLKIINLAIIDSFEVDLLRLLNRQPFLVVSCLNFSSFKCCSNKYAGVKE